MRTIQKQNSNQTLPSQVLSGQTVSQEVVQVIGAPTLEVVRCPNCGSLAERYYSATQHRLQCDQCDYLMATCAQTGRVLEAYAPGISFSARFTAIAVTTRLD